jgi:hypothetical protein
VDISREKSFRFDGTRLYGLIFTVRGVIGVLLSKNGAIKPDQCTYRGFPVEVAIIAATERFPVAENCKISR